MRMCDACCRDFSAKSGTCPYCGYNNTRSYHPRSTASLKAMERRRQKDEELQRQAREESYD